MNNLTNLTKTPCYAAMFTNSFTSGYALLCGAEALVAEMPEDVAPQFSELARLFDSAHTAITGAVERAGLGQEEAAAGQVLALAESRITDAAHSELGAAIGQPLASEMIAALHRHAEAKVVIAAVVLDNSTAAALQEKGWCV